MWQVILLWGLWSLFPPLSLANDSCQRALTSSLLHFAQMKAQLGSLNEQLMALAQDTLGQQGVNSEVTGQRLYIDLEQIPSSPGQEIPFFWRLLKKISAYHPHRLRWCLDPLTCLQDDALGQYDSSSTTLITADLDFLLKQPGQPSHRLGDATLRHEIRHYLGDGKRRRNIPSIYHIQYTALTKEAIVPQTSYGDYLHGEEFKNYSFDLKELLYQLKIPRPTNISKTLWAIDSLASVLEKIALAMGTITGQTIHLLQRLITEAPSAELDNKIITKILFESPQRHLLQITLVQKMIRIRYSLFHRHLESGQENAMKLAIADLSRLYFVARTQQLAARKLIDHVTKLQIAGHHLFLPNTPFNPNPEAALLLDQLPDLILQVAKNAVKYDYH